MYNYIKNPINNKKVIVNSKLGKKILKNYLYIFRGGLGTASRTGSDMESIKSDSDGTHDMSFDTDIPMILDKQGPPTDTSPENFTYTFPSSNPSSNISIKCFVHSESTKKFLQLIDTYLTEQNITDNLTQLFQVVLIKNGNSYMAYLDNAHHDLISIDPSTGQVLPFNYYKVPWLSSNNVNNTVMDNHILEYIAQYLLKIYEIISDKSDGYQFLLQFHYQKKRGESGFEGGLFHKDDSLELKTSFVSLSFLNDEYIHGTEIVSCEDVNAWFLSTKKCEILRPVIAPHGTLIFPNRPLYHSSPASSISERRIETQDLATSFYGRKEEFKHEIVQTFNTSLKNIDKFQKRPDFLRVWLSEEQYFERMPIDANGHAPGVFLGSLTILNDNIVVIKTNPKPDPLRGLSLEQEFIHNIVSPQITLDMVPQLGGK